MLLYGWHCLVLAEFMVVWKWLTALQNKFLNWTMAIQLTIPAELDIYADASRLDISEECSTTEIGKGCEETSRVEMLI